ncbi:MAG: hypothetical protein LBH69_01765 [Methanomassiliicoccaceae archaeon]|jgi:hypothetical protein|nr:hypothetical protein [Methanomassiliicoccaceae archaeon]
MAKKRRREEAEPEDTYEFEPPEFDEREFLLKDLYGTKVLMVVALLAIVVGIIASLIQKASNDLWFIGIILMFLTIFLFKHLMTALRFRVDLMDQKMLIGNYVIFLLLSLGVWIIMLNPPF